jgi:hypothetical protein
MPEIEGPKREPFFAPYGLLRLFLWLLLLAFSVILSNLLWPPLHAVFSYLLGR